MLHNSPSLSIDPALVAKLRARRIVQKELGAFRSFASQAHYLNPAIDEEEFFRMVAEAWVKGMRYEVSKIFGPEKAVELFNGFATRT